MKKRNFKIVMLNLFQHLSNCKYQAERICGSAPCGLPAGGTSQYFHSPLAGEAKKRTAVKPVSESRNHGSGSEVITGASAKLFQEGLGVRGNKGFTLAEVLITLVIIGVIGALTVPSLIQNTQKQEYVSALKKAYSTLSQAANMIIAEEGSPKVSDGGWAVNNTAVHEMFKKYLNNAKECPIGKPGCISQVKYKYLKSGYHPSNWNTSFPSLVLADGMQVIFDSWGFSSGCSNNNCAIIEVDVNGAKGPNEMSRDMFAFYLRPDGIYPMGCGKTSCPNGSAYDCTCLVLTEGAMNY